MTRKTKGMKTVDCREGCGNTMEISEDAVSGMCWRCVNKMMAGPIGDYLPSHDEDPDETNEGDENEQDD